MTRRLCAKIIRIACLGVPSDYRTSLVPLIIQSLGYKIYWVSPIRSDLLIYGSFYDVNSPRMRWLPRAWRGQASALVDFVQKELKKRRIQPLTLFHTGENLRHDHIKADYAISHDIHASLDRHFRLPYWMEVVDWSHEGIIGNINPRYGELLQLKKLQAPLGNQFLHREQKAALITSHLREPRASCFEVLKKFMPVDGMGPYFDIQIKNHHSSDFQKKNILQNYAYNLCPENSTHSGYVTEKIPEAFASGCLPITYVDESVSIDFNPKAMINMKVFRDEQYDGLQKILSHRFLEAYSQEPLIVQKPSLQMLKFFLNTISGSAV